MTTKNNPFADQLGERLQQYRAKVDALHRQKLEVEEKLKIYESLCQDCERLLKADQISTEGIEISAEVLKPAAISDQSTENISVPQAVDYVLRSNQRPMHIREIYERVKELYPNLIVANLRKQVGVSVLRGMEAKKYERIDRGVYKIKV